MPKNSKSSDNKNARLIYKPDSQSTDEYFVFVNLPEYKDFSAGGSSTVGDVLALDDIFYSNQGNQGIVGQASDQQLSTVFNTSDKFEIRNFMLKNGVLQGAARFDSEGGGNKNLARGGGSVDAGGR